jgi:replication factor C large subunit
MTSKKVPWVIKYRPKTIDEVEDQEEAKRVLIPWIKEWAEGKPPAKRAALLYGPPGVGKTSLVEAIAKEFKFEYLELNASDYRRAEDIRKTVGVAATKRPLWGRGIIILLDEIDGISAKEDAGGLSELLKIIPNARNPIIMTANDPWKDQLKPLRDIALMVEFKPLGLRSMINVLERICKAEKIYCEKDALRYIVEKSEGDLRAAINDLEAVAEGYGRVTMDLVRALVKGREKSIDLWKTLNGVFYAKYAWSAKRAVTNSEEDYETLMAWINDNIPRKYQDPEDLFRAFDALSRASVFLSRAKYGGDWALLSYVFDLMGPGVAFARKGEYAKGRYAYPERIKLMGQLKSKREMREKIAESFSRRLLMSKREFKNEVLPYLFIIFRETPSPIPAARIALGYRLTKEEIEFLAGPRAKEVLMAIEKIRRAGRAPPEETKEEKPKAKKTTKTVRRRQKTLF